MALTRIKVDNLSTAVLDKIRELSIDSSTALSLFSVTDNGGDGSLTYNNSTGVIEYTGPSAAEVRAHLSAGGDLHMTPQLVNLVLMFRKVIQRLTLTVI